MSILRRVFLLLTVAVLLREGSSNSPFDFLRDLKNKIFSSSNTTGSVEEPPVQCSSLDQDGVCNLQKTVDNGTLNESDNLKNTEMFDNTDTINGSLSSGSDIIEKDQLVGNETVIDETFNTNSTQYYDEQEWNSTASKNTVNYGNDFDFSENRLNGSDINNEDVTVNGDRTNSQGNTRKKRQINKLKINFTLKTPGITSKPLTLRKTNLTSETENSTESSVNHLNNTTGVKEAIENASKNNTSMITNESIIIDFNQSAVMTEIGGNDTNAPTNTTMDGSEEIVLGSNETINHFSKSEEINKNESILTDCTNCVAEDKKLGFQNISLSLDEVVNETEPTEVEKDKFYQIPKQVDYNHIVSLETNIAKLHDILENSTLLIKDLVQNITPDIYKVINETKENQKNDTKLQSTVLEITKTIEEMINSSDITTQNLNGTETQSGDKANDRQFNSTIRMTNITGMDNLLKSLNKTFDANDFTALFSIANHEEIKRETRSINFTILSDDEESDFSLSTFPDTTESPAEELQPTVITNSTESSPWNGTHEIEIVGPVCRKRYEPCINSTDCCEDQECVGAEENNGTLFCDLRPVNLTLPTNLPITEEKAE